MDVDVDADLVEDVHVDVPVAMDVDVDADLVVVFTVHVEWLQM